MKNAVRNGLAGLLTASGFLLSDYQTETYAQERAPPASKQVSFEDVLKSQLGEVLKLGTLDALKNIGFNGGYLDSKPEKYFSAEKGIRIPFYYDKGKLSMPSLSDIEGQIADHIESKSIEFSADKKYLFRKPNTKIETEVKITKGKIELKHEIDFQLFGSGLDKVQGNKLYKFRDEAEVGSRLFGMYQVAKYVAESDEEDPGMIEISELSDKLGKFGLKFNTYQDTGMKGTIFNRISIRDKESDPSVSLEALRSNNFKRVLGDVIKSDRKKMEKGAGPFSFYFSSRYSDGKKTDVPAPPAPGRRVLRGLDEDVPPAPRKYGQKKVIRPALRKYGGKAPPVPKKWSKAGAPPPKRKKKKYS